MNKVLFRRDTCRLCGGKRLESALKLVPTPVGDAYVPAERVKEDQESFPLELFLCGECGASQLLDVVNPEILYGNYIYETSISLGLSEHFQKYADEVLNYIKPPSGGLVVDIGSNDGTLLKFFKSRGMAVLGIDPAPEAVRKAQELGVRTLRGFFTVDLARKIKKKHGPASIITANNVFANIDDLVEVISGIRELIAPDGCFVFETGYVVDLIRYKLIDNIYHEHLSYYAVKPLRTFFRKNGMELIDVKRVPTKGGSFRGIVQLQKGPRAISPSVNEMVAVETRLGIDRTLIFRNVLISVERVKKELSGLIRGITARGEKIAAYGASVGVTTLIYLFDLAGKLNFIVDDNPARQNLFTPGHHIPVLPPQAIYDKKPDYLLILAWRYNGPIMERHQAYLKQGGHFIIPLPEVKIV